MAKQEIEHSGFRYEVDKVADLVTAGMKEKDALREAYPTLPSKSIAPILTKMRKHPYYVARKELNLAIIEAKGPALQQNLLDLAFNARSEMVRANTTIDALDRVYGKQGEAVDEKPTFIFNFGMMADKQPKVQIDAEKGVIDVG